MSEPVFKNWTRIADDMVVNLDYVSKIQLKLTDKRIIFYHPVPSGTSGSTQAVTYATSDDAQAMFNLVMANIESRVTDIRFITRQFDFIDPSTVSFGAQSNVEIEGTNLCPQDAIDSGKLRVTFKKDGSGITPLDGVIVTATPSDIVVTVPILDGTGVNYACQVQIWNGDVLLCSDNSFLTITS